MRLRIILMNGESAYFAEGHTARVADSGALEVYGPGERRENVFVDKGRFYWHYPVVKIYGPAAWMTWGVEEG